jgi:hypothetical protein
MLNYTTRGFAVLDELVCTEYIIWWQKRKFAAANKKLLEGNKA